MSMNKKHFYEPLIETSELSLSLGDLELSQEERIELIHIVRKNMHYIVIDIVLSELPENEKKVFLKNMHEEDNEVTWKHLKENIKDVEEKIREASRKALREHIRDIREK